MAPNIPVTWHVCHGVTYLVFRSNLFGFLEFHVGVK